MRWDQLVNKLLLLGKFVGYAVIAWFTYANFITEGMNLDSALVKDLVNTPLVKWIIAVSILEVLHNIWGFLGLGEK
ncbi:hypothetical protein [Cohnella sp. AR92]|uniref:hypothetical protein n=1 Tax=Cohnella sp. AR92 TaxID=648716 RepID=UPI000F8E77F8|nr:hypothetical protein [Cohnella sp. AR92]RUS48861.1 hypothetical protein ELR57_00485 [Cohnella sp. AR92]